MADELDVEAMLEAPYRKEDEIKNGKDKGSSRDKDRDRDRDRKRRSRSRDRKRSRSRERKDRGERDRDRRDRDRDRPRDKDRDSRRKRSRSRSRDKRSRRSRSPSFNRPPRRSRSKSPYGGAGGGAGAGGAGAGPPAWKNKKRSPSPNSREFANQPYGSMRLTRNNLPELTPEERDARTVFCMQLPSSIRPRDIEAFFSSVGKVRDVRIITDNKTRRSKGIAYVEFAECESVALALGLNGQPLKGKPITVQASQAEKNRTGNPTAILPGMDHKGPMRLYVGSLHFNITEEMLRGIFEPFGKIDHINLVMDSESGRSKGFGFVTFQTADDAKKALEQLNGFELAGRPMKVGHVTERTADTQGAAMLDSDEMDRAGIDLGATGRLALMAKLAEGTGFEIPPVAANALSLTQPTEAAPPVPQQAAVTTAPPIATQCFMLSNMFNPVTESEPGWDQEIKDDVINECNKHGGVFHIYVDKTSPTGNVYVKCPSIAAAVASVQALHGRFFARKVITAAYVPLPNYHQLFPDAQVARSLLMSSAQHQAQLQYASQYGAAAGMMGAMQQGLLPP
ncbi:RNA-binding protein 39-like isoform X2 [Tubulanus polymorphus]|uniref:RNA-binding protein 39-like isoform X2 n=1 Tax=Tubulanus polymorphus TaxID=672921 RepID=UPI003DA66534